MFSTSLIPIPIPILMLSLLILLPLLVIIAIKGTAIKSRVEVATLLIAALIVIEVLMIKLIFNRPGLLRTCWGVWPLIPQFVYGISRVHSLGTQTKLNRDESGRLTISSNQIVALALALIAAFSNYFYAYQNFFAFAAFKANTISLKPGVDLVSNSLKETASKLATMHGGCFLS